MPMNFLLIQSLREFHQYYGTSLKVAYPAGSDNLLPLNKIADDISRRLVSIFQKDEEGKRPVHALHSIYEQDPYFKELILFYEYFHGDTGRGVGATHQTGWTGVVAELIDTACWK